MLRSQGGHVTTATLSSSANEASAKNYAIISGLLALYAAMLTFVSRWTAPLDKEALLAPMGAMFALTGMVLLLTATARNYATIRKLASVHYYRTYDHASHPPDWIERPARTFNNLLQVPTL